MSVLEEKIVNVKEIKWLYEKIKTALNGKVDKEDGKGLSTNDYTTADKKKLEDTSKDLGATSKKLDNLIKLSQGKVFDYQTDETEAYSKAVPLGSQKYGSLDMVGGKSLVYNQLSKLTDVAAGTKSGITVTKDVDNITVTLNGTSTSAYSDWMEHFTPIVNHSYYIFGCPSGGASETYWLGFGNKRDYGEGAIYTAPDTAKLYFTYRITKDYEYTNFVYKPRLVDLTQMFGAGYEPTLEQCREIFSDGYYPYSEGELMSFGVNAVESKKGIRKETFTIPQSILDLPDYGASAGSVYNYIDFERKVYVQNVGSVDLGTLTWVVDATSAYTSGIQDTVKKDTANFKSIKYVFGTNVGRSRLLEGQCGLNGPISGVFCVKDSNYTTASELKSALNGVMLNYELATPIETDISDLIDNGLIFAEGGGTITFKNVKGDEYHIPVPNKETYMVKLADSI